MKSFLAFLFSVISLPLLSLPTDMYIGGQYAYYSTNNLWNNHGTLLPAHNEFMRHDAKVYGGLDFSLTSCGWVQGGFDSVRQEVNPDRHGFEDSNIGFYKVLKQACQHSYGWGLQVNVPGGDPRPALRYGAWMGELYLSFEKQLKNLHYTFDLGYQVYTRGVSDSIRGAFRIDWPFTRRIQLTAQGDLYYSLFNGKRHFHDNRIAYNPNTRLLKGKILAVYRVTNTIYLNAGYFKHVWGQNVGSGAGVFGGAFWNY